MYVMRPFNFSLVARSLRNIFCLRRAASNLITENSVSEARIEKLGERSILGVSGRDAFDFLQSLITNDLNGLLKEKQSIYTTFLNGRGRVIHDAIIYKSLKENSFLIESDIFSNEALQIHLTMHQKFREVIFENLEHRYTIWTIFNSKKALTSYSAGLMNKGTQEAGDLSFLEEIDFGEEVIVCYDPRIISLGIRIVAPKECDIINLIKVNGYCVNKAKPGEFKLFRYKLGICEGINEILYGKHTPCELNCDYLNAISNKKDYYLGTNAVQSFLNSNAESRLMPMKMLSNRVVNFPSNTPIRDLERRKKTPLGYLRGMLGLHGIAVVRLLNNDCEKEVRIGNILALCSRPFWWPDLQKSIPAKQNICNV